MVNDFDEAEKQFEAIDPRAQHHTIKTMLRVSERDNRRLRQALRDIERDLLEICEGDCSDEMMEALLPIIGRAACAVP